jgi:DNA repair exonuclease SbcCD ATPase subunit
MHLSFGKLKIQHFALFREPQVIDLGRAPGLYYVRGVNQVEPKLGANDVGKSSIFKAMLYVLFGQASPQLKSTDIKPWDDDGKLSVTLQVFRDGKSCWVNRGAKPSSILIDGQSAGQDQIDKLLGLSFETFTNTILLAQGAELFLDLTPANKMKMFSDVLGLERWDARSRFASATAADLAKRQAEWQGELTGLQSSRNQLKELEGKARQDAEAWEAARQEVLTKADKEIEALESDIAKVQRIVDEAILSMDGAGTEAKAIQHELDRLGQDLLERQGELGQAQERTFVLAEEIKAAGAEINSLNKAKVCPTCGQKVKGDLSKHRRELEGEQNKLSDKLTKYMKRRMELELAVGQIQDQRSKVNERLHNFRDREERASDVLANAKPRLLGYQNALKYQKAQRDDYRNDDNPHQAQMRDLKKRRAKVEGEMEELQEDLTKLARRIERTQFWVKGFKELQLQVVEETLEELEMATNATLPEMGLEDWSIEYAAEKETKSGTIKQELNATVLSPYNDKPVRWESWGGGVGQRLRVAGSLALGEVLLNHAGVTCDLEVLDEPSRGMSSEGIDDLIEMLADRAKRLGKVIWFVDHRLHESTAFAGTVAVTKTKAGSVVNA